MAGTRLKRKQPALPGRSRRRRQRGRQRPGCTARQGECRQSDRLAHHHCEAEHRCSASLADIHFPPACGDEPRSTAPLSGPPGCRATNRTRPRAGLETSNGRADNGSTRRLFSHPPDTRSRPARAIHGDAKVDATGSPGTAAAAWTARSAGRVHQRRSGQQRQRTGGPQRWASPA